MKKTPWKHPDGRTPKTPPPPRYLVKHYPAMSSWSWFVEDTKLGTNIVRCTQRSDVRRICTLLNTSPQKGRR